MTKWASHGCIANYPWRSTCRRACKDDSPRKESEHLFLNIRAGTTHQYGRNELALVHENLLPAGVQSAEGAMVDHTTSTQKLGASSDARSFQKGRITRRQQRNDWRAIKQAMPQPNRSLALYHLCKLQGCPSQAPCRQPTGSRPLFLAALGLAAVYMRVVYDRLMQHVSQNEVASGKQKRKKEGCSQMSLTGRHRSQQDHRSLAVRTAWRCETGLRRGGGHVGRHEKGGKRERAEAGE